MFVQDHLRTLKSSQHDTKSDVYKGVNVCILLGNIMFNKTESLCNLLDAVHVAINWKHKHSIVWYLTSHGTNDDNHDPESQMLHLQFYQDLIDWEYDI